MPPKKNEYIRYSCRRRRLAPCALRRGLVLTEMMMTEHQSGPRRLGRSLAGTRDLILPFLRALAVPRRASPEGAMVDDDVYLRETPPHIRTARASPQRHTAASTAAPTTADTGNTVPQRANPTQTAYAHPRRRALAEGQPNTHIYIYT